MFPGLPCFYLPFAFTIIHRIRRPAKNWEGLGVFITCVARWTWGADIQIRNILNLKPICYRSRRVVSITLRSGVQNCGRALKQIIQCIVLAVGTLPLPSTSHLPDIIHVINVPRPFAALLLPCILGNANRR